MSDPIFKEGERIEFKGGVFFAQKKKPDLNIGV